MEVNLFLATKFQPELIIRAILLVALNLRSKIKIEIEKKILLKCDTQCLEMVSERE